MLVVRTVMKKIFTRAHDIRQSRPGELLLFSFTCSLFHQLPSTRPWHPQRLPPPLPLRWEPGHPSAWLPPPAFPSLKDKMVRITHKKLRSPFSLLVSPVLDDWQHFRPVLDFKAQQLAQAFRIDGRWFPIYCKSSSVGGKSVLWPRLPLKDAKHSPEIP